MQLPPDEQEFLCRAFHIEGKPIRQIQRETGHSRQAIRNAIANHPVPTPLKHVSPASSRPHPAPIFGPFQRRVESLISQNDSLPRKQRYTAHRIFEIIREEGYNTHE